MQTATEHRLRRVSPESQGIASSAVLQFVEAVENQIHELHSFMLLRHGHVAAEGWWSPYGSQHPHMLFSLSKSFTSTAVGLAIDEGRLSLDDLVLSFFPDDAPAEVNDHLAAMRVRHLLSMSTGHAEDSTPHMVMQPEGDWVKGFLEVPVLHEPGTHFLYDTGATFMLSAIIQKVTGQKLIDYLQPRLFKPLGIENPTWEENPQRINVGGWGLNIKTEDIARFGQLYLQKGMWQGKQLVPEAWVEEATAFHMKNGDDPENDWSQGYGYQFWRCRHNAYRGDGAFGQYCIVMPEQDAVLAITGGVDILDMQPPLNLVWDILLPAMHDDALPDDPAAFNKLTQKLASLNIAPVQGVASSSTAASISGQTYQVDTNPLNLQTLVFEFTASGCTVKFKSDRGEETFPCGDGVWQAGKTTLFNEFWQFDPQAIVTSGAWTDDHTFTMVIRRYETPFFHTFTFGFEGDELIIETRVNASFESLKPVLLTAHRTSTQPEKA